MQGSLQSRGRPGTVLLAIVVCAIATIAAAWDGAESQGSREVVLTPQAPEALFPLDQERVNRGETTVLLRLVRAENPERVNFAVSVTLAECRGGTKGTAPVGAMGLYPSGKTEGSYAFDLGPALTRMHNMGVERGQVCLRLGLKPMGVAADWKGLRVTVTRPKWQQPPAH
jgi:hypothetical protein